MLYPLSYPHCCRVGFEPTTLRSTKYLLHTTLFVLAVKNRCHLFLKRAITKRVYKGFEPFVFRLFQTKYLFSTASFIYQKQKSIQERGFRIKDLHLFPICTRTLPLVWSDETRFYGILIISSKNFKSSGPD
jgi:hypothetical protein